MNKRISHVVIALVIILTMVNNYSFKSNAKTAFKNLKPLGVMATAVEDKIAVSFESVDGADGYIIYEAKEGSEYIECKDLKGCYAVFSEKEPGKEYSYYVKAYKNKAGGAKTVSRASDEASTRVQVLGKSTVKNLLKTSLNPVGSTMYVWGGGWNKADTGAGTEARRVGVSSKWRSFAKNKKKSYNYRNYRYQIHNGLDCSGYVGWVVYNVMNTENGKKGYVYSASRQAKKFSEQGFGIYTTACKVKDYKAGDIMSSTCSCCGHVWIVVGQCKDKSVVLIHSSPAGVQLAGTVTPKNKKNSQAYKLAKKYMKKYYKSWYKKYPTVAKNKQYLSHYSQMRWYTAGDKTILSDPEGYEDMTADEILKDLFGEK